MTTTGVWIYCKNFNKKRYYEIEDKISLNKFKEIGNINNISKLGIECFNKEIYWNFVKFLSQ